MRQPLAFDPVLLDILFHARQRQRARGLRHSTDIFKQIFHRGTNGIAVDGDDVIDVFLTEPEGFGANPFHRHPFGKQPDARQIDRMTRLQRCFQAG